MLDANVCRGGSHMRTKADREGGKNMFFYGRRRVRALYADILENLCAKFHIFLCMFMTNSLEYMYIIGICISCVYLQVVQIVTYNISESIFAILVGLLWLLQNVDFFSYTF